MNKIILAFLCIIAFTQSALSEQLVVSTVTRAPFSHIEDGRDTGFSIELWEEIATDLALDYRLDRHDSFTEMLQAVKTGTSDAAIANISITSAREKDMDFSHPIFSSGLRTMIPQSSHNNFSFLTALFSWEFLFAIIAAFSLLLLAGMLMWRLERDEQEYFDKPAKEALFPAFWWALNLIVNGGFEERMPRSPLGRLLGVVLVIASLFIVSVFVARITTTMTVNAIENSVSSVNDLYGKRVGTIQGSTAETFLENRDIRVRTSDGLIELLQDFENKKYDAVVFDAPVLAYYTNTDGEDIGELVGPMFQLESYGIALPTDSPLNEPINQSLLRLRENGTYDQLYRKWFGEDP